MAIEVFAAGKALFGSIFSKNSIWGWLIGIVIVGLILKLFIYNPISNKFEELNTRITLLEQELQVTKDENKRLNSELLNKQAELIVANAQIAKLTATIEEQNVAIDNNRIDDSKYNNISANLNNLTYNIQELNYIMESYNKGEPINTNQLLSIIKNIKLKDL